jgi:hypothetical protein
MFAGREYLEISRKEDERTMLKQLETFMSSMVMATKVTRQIIIAVLVK